MPLPALAAPLITAGASTLGSVISGLFGSSSQKSANEANIQMQRETNEMNERLFHENLAWQEDMWNKTNAYNDPSHQIELLQRAGINPASVYGNGSMPTASSMAAPSAPQMQAAQVNPVDYSWIGNVVDQGINAFFESQIKNNEVKRGINENIISGVQAELDTITMANRAARIANDSKKSEFERETARMELKFLTSTFKDRVMQTEQLTQIQDKQIDDLVNRIAESKLHQDALRIANQFAPRLNEAQLRSFQANVSAAYAAARASDAAALDSAAHAAVNDVIKEGQSLDNRSKKILFTYVKEEAKANADKAKEEAKTASSRNKYGEVRQRFLGSEKYSSNLDNTILGPGLNDIKAIYHGYKKGVESGIKKSKNKKKSNSW